MNIDVGAYLASLDAILQKDNETVLYLDKKDQLILAWNDENGAADSFSGTKFKNSGQENSWKKKALNMRFFQIGGEPVRDCLGCGQCSEKGCVF